jgi:DNA end-binding protein Ku
MTRQHLAAVKPQEKGLMLEMMHFASQLLDADDFKLPGAAEVGKKEMQMARSLIDSMSDEWKPEEYVDEYRAALEKVIDEKAHKGDTSALKPARRRKPTNVIDLVSVLQKSLEQSGSKKRKRAPRPAAKTRRKAA